MRASRLLLMLLMLQNRGPMTCAELADELEVSRRTILRDVDALVEAGLPMLARRGRTGGIELGFNYRTRLTGLSATEAEALGVLLGLMSPVVDELQLGQAASMMRTKLLESLPADVRETACLAERQFPLSFAETTPLDARVRAMAAAVRQCRIVRLDAYRPQEQTIHPITLAYRHNGWEVVDDRTEQSIPIRAWGRINLSRRTFSPRA
ncbi:MAG: helix-turn-helix transcriptional regulator [Nocardioides sp.]